MPFSNLPPSTSSSLSSAEPSLISPVPLRPSLPPSGSSLTSALLFRYQLDALEGETPVGSPAPSEYGGPTRVGSPEPGYVAEKVETGLRKDLEQGKDQQGWEIVKTTLPLDAPLPPHCDEEKLAPASLREEGAAQDVYPEGGWRAYGAVLGAVLVLLSTFGLSNSFGVFQRHYLSDPTLELSHLSPSTVSWIGSCHLGLTFASSLVSGWLFDRGYFRIQLAAGSALWLIGIFFLSLSTTYTQIFLSHAVCLGLAVGAIFGPCLSCIATHFQRRRSLVVGCATAGAGLGAVVLPIMLNRLFPVLGFGGTMRAVGYLMTGLLVIANLIMKPRALPAKERKAAGPLLASFAKQLDYWLVCLGCFGCMIGCFTPLIYIVLYAKSRGVSALLQDYSLSIINGTAVLARISSGLIADRIGIFNTAVPFTLLLAAMDFAMLGATNNGTTVAFCIGLGVASGGFISLMPSCFLALAADASEFGLRSGVGFLFVSIAALIGSPVAGILLTVANGSYVAPMSFAGAMAFLGCACLAGARKMQATKKASWKV